jgi:hypothetical protein
MERSLCGKHQSIVAVRMPKKNNGIHYFLNIPICVSSRVPAQLQLSQL